MIDLGGGTFVPQIGHTFVIVNALGELAGTFDTSRLDIPGIGLGWSVDYDYNADQVLLEVVSTADYNDDGVLDCADIDLLQQAILAGSNDLRFDVNGDRLIDSADFRDWVTGAKGTILGDANLDFVVDVTDFNIWNTNKFTSGAGYCGGDFTGDGNVDVSDFNVWNANKFTSAIPAAVPEPGNLVWLLAGVRVWSLRRRATRTTLHLLGGSADRRRRSRVHGGHHRGAWQACCPGPLRSNH